jgi:predicted enzyme related to lactoylglutathione lyase
VNDLELIFSKAINKIVQDQGVENTIKFYSDAFGWSREQVIALIRKFVYPML